MYARLKATLRRLYKKVYFAKTLENKDKVKLRRCLHECRKEYHRIWHIYIRRKNGHLVVVSYDEFIPRERCLTKVQEKLLGLLGKK